MTRTRPAAPHPELERYYKLYCEAESDIHKHLPKLRELASQCETVCEMGVRGAVSTIALLAGEPDELVSYDIDPNAILSDNVRALMGMVVDRPGGQVTKFQPRVADTLHLTVTPADLIFIDTWHTHDQLRAELQLHGSYAQKWIAFHDTETFGRTGMDGRSPGLRQAIQDWIEERWCYHKEYWDPVWDNRENNGLLVIELKESHFDRPKARKVV